MFLGEYFVCWRRSCIVLFDSGKSMVRRHHLFDDEKVCISYGGFGV